MACGGTGANSFVPPAASCRHASAGRRSEPPVGLQRSVQTWSGAGPTPSFQYSMRSDVIAPVGSADAVAPAASATHARTSVRTVRIESQSTPRVRSRLARVALTGKRVVITGGAGFSGTTLARRLVDDNEIVAVDNLHRDTLGGTALAGHPNFRFVQGDVLDAASLTDLVQGATHLVHAAAIA